MTALDDATQGRRPASAAASEPMPWRPIVAVVTVILLAAAAFIGPTLFGRPFLASLIEGRLCAALRVECHVAGSIRARLLPFPMIEMDEVTLALPERKVTLSVPHVAAELRALPLLFGRLSVNHLDLSQATIEVAAPPGGMRLFASADGAGTALVDAIITADRQGDRLTRIGLDRSRVMLRSESARHDIAIEALSGVAAWPQGGGELFAHFGGFVAGQPADLRIEGPNLADLARAEGSPLSLSVALGGNWLAYRGRLVKAPDLVVAGAMEAMLPSAKRLITPFHRLKWPSWLPEMAGHFVAHAFVTARGVDFENVEMMIGRSSFAGGMSLRMTPDGRPSLSGTIATQLVDLNDLIIPRPQDVVLPSFGRLPDLDLRMSARSVRLAGRTIDGIAAGLILAVHRFDFTVSQSSTADAGGKLHLIATPDQEGVSVKVLASSDKIDIGSFLSGFAANPGLKGIGGFNIALDGHGDNLARVERSLAGKVRLQMQQGAFSLSLDGRSVPPLEGGNPGEFGGQALTRRFASASFAGVAERGVLVLTEGSIGEGASQIVVGGKVDLADRRLDLSLASAGDAPAEAPWRLRVTGPWADPSIWHAPAAAK
jgi:AsmA protein